LENDVKYVIWPIKEPEMVNAIRKEMGFTTTVEAYAKMLNIEYQNYTLQEVNEMNKMK
jgi:hypothetical protein